MLTKRKMKKTYKTFLRSATSSERIIHTGLTYDEALRACNNYNTLRTSLQIRQGIKLEFIVE